MLIRTKRKRKTAAERPGRRASPRESRQDDIEKTIIDVLIERFETLTEPDDLKMLLLVAAEIRQWYFSAKKIKIDETSVPMDMKSTLDLFRKNYAKIVE